MIPRKILSTIDKRKLTDHMVNDMVGEDRRLRFCYPAQDMSVKLYIERSFENLGWDNMWFVIEDAGRIVASCHVAYDEKRNVAEIAFTVNPDYRGQGLGQQLFDRGVTWARMRGAKGLFMTCLGENKITQHIAKKNKMTVVNMDGDREATLDLDKSQLAAAMEDMMSDRMAVYEQAARDTRHLWCAWFR
jgi:GNAT superfamily N-acetyltransferase